MFWWGGSASCYFWLCNCNCKHPGRRAGLLGSGHWAGHRSEPTMHDGLRFLPRPGRCDRVEDGIDRRRRVPFHSARRVFVLPPASIMPRSSVRFFICCMQCTYASLSRLHLHRARNRRRHCEWPWGWVRSRRSTLQFCRVSLCFSCHAPPHSFVRFFITCNTRARLYPFLCTPLILNYKCMFFLKK